MIVKNADLALHRTDKMDITECVLSELISMEVNVPALELDDECDNIFFSIDKDGGLTHNTYLQIRLDSSYYSDKSVYFVEVFERQHSGGDILLYECYEFFPEDKEKYIDKIRDAYIAYLTS